MDILRWLELKKREIGFSHNALVIIAMFTMFLDHFAFIIISGGKLYGYDPTLFQNAIKLPEAKKWLLLYSILRIIGRISFPIFSFLIVEGFRKSSNVFKYIIRVFILAIVSELPFDLMIFNKLSFDCFQVQNVLWTYFIALIMLSTIKLMSNLPIFLTIFPAIIAAIITFFLKSDYWIEGIILTYIFYIFRHDLNLKCLFTLIATFLMTINNYYGLGILSVFFIYFYDGTKGYFDLRRLHYLFYPLHILILYFALYFSNIYD